MFWPKKLRLLIEVKRYWLTRLKKKRMSTAKNDRRKGETMPAKMCRAGHLRIAVELGSDLMGLSAATEMRIGVGVAAAF